MRTVLLLVALVATFAVVHVSAAKTWEERVCGWYDDVTQSDALLAAQLTGGRDALASGSCAAVSEADRALLNGDAGVCKDHPVPAMRFSLPMGLIPSDTLTAASTLQQGAGLLGLLSPACAAALPPFSCVGSFTPCVMCNGVAVPALVSRETCLAFADACSLSNPANGAMSFVWPSIVPEGNEQAFREACATFPPECRASPANDKQCAGDVVEPSGGAIKFIVKSQRPAGVREVPAVRRPAVDCSGAASISAVGSRNGVATVNDVAAGNYECSIVAKGYVSDMVTVTVVEGETARVVVELAPKEVKISVSSVNRRNKPYVNRKARFTCVPVAGIASANFAINAIEDMSFSKRGLRKVKREPGVYECTWRCRDGSCVDGPAGNEPFVIDATVPGKTVKARFVFEVPASSS